MKNRKSARAIAPMTNNQLFKALTHAAKKYAASNPCAGVIYDANLSENSPYVTFNLLVGSKADLRGRWVAVMMDDIEVTCNDYDIILSNSQHGVVCAWFDTPNGHADEIVYGSALCCPGDKFDETVGLAVAWAKARGYNIPDFV